MSTRPPLYAKQKAAIFCDERYAVIEASTKSGKNLRLHRLALRACSGEAGRRNGVFIQPGTKTIKARIGWYNLGVLTPNWYAAIDQTVWEIAP
ncbi:MAG: hypothetical protein ACR2HJ_11645 [Fimbriimonadales bacterium]